MIQALVRLSILPALLEAQLYSEYRSAIFYHTPEQKEIAERVTAEVQKAHVDPRGKKIATEIAKAGPWYDAEDYHQGTPHRCA